MKNLPRIVLLAIVGAAGCAEPIKLVPAEGVVEIGGAPAEGILVQFMPRADGDSKRPSSMGTTDAEGRFVLVTHKGEPGAVVGEHVVVLADGLAERAAQGSRAAKPPRLDSRYSTAAGGITATVTGGSEIIRIQVPAL